MSLNNRQKGAASLITVIFISIVLSIIVLGFVRLAVREQRQAVDNDLTTRAFYAAESGIEDAKRAILQDISGSPIDLKETTCDHATDGSTNFPANGNVLSPPDEFDTEYVCQIIDQSPADYAATLEKNETLQIELDSNSVKFNRVLVQWHINDNAVDGEAPAIRTAGITTLPPESDWKDSTSGDAYPAMLRAELFSHVSSITRKDLEKFNVAFLNPTDSSSTIEIENAPALPNPKTFKNHGIVDSRCVVGVVGDYVCSQIFKVDGSSTVINYIRLTSLYTGASISVSLLNSSDLNIPLYNNQVIVDVTGRASDVYRRIEARIDIASGSGALIPRFAIATGDDICKNLQVPPATLPALYKPNSCT